MILDTDVLIWRLRGHSGALKLVEEVPPGERCLSAVTYLELLYGCRDKDERRRLGQSVAGHFAQILPITEAISEAALHLMEKYVLAHRPAPSDVLIAATALVRNETLITGNRKHYDFFAGLDLKIFRP